MKDDLTDLVVVHTFFNHIEADLSLLKLSQAGIQAILSNEELLLVNPAAENIEGIQLKVRNEDLAKAQEILELVPE